MITKQIIGNELYVQEKLEKIQNTIDKLTTEEYNLLQEHIQKQRPQNVTRSQVPDYYSK